MATGSPSGIIPTTWLIPIMRMSLNGMPAQQADAHDHAEHHARRPR